MPITNNCTCWGCNSWNNLTEEQKALPPSSPRPKPQIPSQFKWKTMLAADQYWTVLVTCKICKWEHFSDYWMAQEQLWFHYDDNCIKPTKKWSN